MFSGYLSTGCVTFSKYPIIDTLFQKYSFNGYFWDIFHSDWYAGKGITGVIIQHPKKNIYFFNTHVINYFIYIPGQKNHNRVPLLKFFLGLTNFFAIIICGKLFFSGQSLQNFVLYFFSKIKIIQFFTFLFFFVRLINKTT